jgi:hypothetical protein
MPHHIKTYYGNLPAGEDTELVSGSVFLYGITYRRIDTILGSN